jgi:parallel beta-helix repeat protein
VAGSNNTLVGCSILKTAGSGILLEGNNNRVTDCTIQDVDYQGLYSCAVRVSGTGNILEWSTMTRAGRDIIQISGKNSSILHNDISHPGLLCADRGMIYTYDTDGAGSEIAYNWVHDSPAPINPGIYLDNYCKNYLVHHNVVWNCLKDAGIRINGPSSGHQIYNNTIFNADSVGSHTYSKDLTLPTTFVSMNNLLIKNPETELMDIAKKNFMLVALSPYIDKGQVIAGITDGFKGTAPDLGAYESGGEVWKAGARIVTTVGIRVNHNASQRVQGTSMPKVVYYQGKLLPSPAVRATRRSPRSLRDFRGKSVLLKN